MRDKMFIGPVPCDESCEQLGPNYRPEVARAECRLFIELLKKEFGEPPEGARLICAGESHDFGTYYEVAVSFDDGNREQMEYAFRVEGESPAEWPPAFKKRAEKLRQGDFEGGSHRGNS